MDRLNQTNNVINSLELGQTFTVKINGTSRTIKANMNWEGISIDKFYEIAWRGWVVAIQAKVRQASPMEIAEWERSGSVINLAELFSESQNITQKEKILILEKEKVEERMAVIKGVLPELLEPNRIDELKDVLVDMSSEGISYIFSYELKE